MKLKETIDIRYKSIIDHGNSEKITDRFEGKAIHEVLFNEESYTFMHKQYGRMQIQLKGGKVVLSHGNSKMEMIHERYHSIMYPTPYGEIKLEVYLKKLTRTNQSLHLVYYLYDKTNLLSKCYLMIDEINPILS